MCGVTDYFPLGTWGEFLPQVELMLNLLVKYNISPNMSVHAHLTGPHGLKIITLAPLGCTFLMHNNPLKRLMWAPHDINIWCVDTSIEHYWCYTVWEKDTRSKRVSYTVFF